MTYTRADLPVDPQDEQMIRDMLAAAQSGSGYRVETPDVQKMRESNATLLASPIFLQPDPAASITSGAAGGISGEWLTPPEVTGEGIIVFYFGGGYVRGDLAFGRANAGRIALKTGMKVFMPSYRQGPENPFPAAYEDAFAVARALSSTGTPFALCGESAGGGLAVAATMGLRDTGAPLPRAIAGISPFFDLTLSGESWAFNEGKDMATHKMGMSMLALYIGDGDRTDWRGSPVYGDFSGLPPLHITVGSHEGLLSETLTTAEKADTAGVPVVVDVYEGMVHGFSKYRLKAAETAITRVSQWLRGQLIAGPQHT